MTPDEEREAFAEFSSLHSEPAYRTPMKAMYDTWRDLNDRHYAGRLKVPHLSIGRTAPRNLGDCKRISNHGGQIQITFNEGLLLRNRAEWLVRPWLKAEGARRFVDDLLLRFTVQQYVIEVLEDEEDNFGGFGPKFVAEANRIGEKLNLGDVTRRHRDRNTRQPVAIGWPHCVREEGYYGDDVTERALEQAGCNLSRQAGMASALGGPWELVTYLARSGRAEEALGLMERHVGWVKEAEPGDWPQRKKAEEGEQDVDGQPLGEVEFKAAWLAWNGGTVRRIAEGIEAFRSFGDLPVLAEALAEAGCADERILRHLRARMRHSRGCWVVRGLLAQGGVQ